MSDGWWLAGLAVTVSLMGFVAGFWAGADWKEDSPRKD
jgi:hypothetical protein